MLGAIIGDIAGSVYEFNNHKSKDFPFLRTECRFTDDSVMTIAVGNVCRKIKNATVITNWETSFCHEMHHLGNAYPDCGYGRRFLQWLESAEPKPYNSMGNGSAMRVSPIALISDTMEECLHLARLSALPTHNHPEGILGAQAVAAAGWMARQSCSKEHIRRYIEENFYKLDFTLDSIRKNYSFSALCRDTVPQAIQAFLESDSFEDAVRNAISIGGDSDTLAAIAGGIAEPYYGIPADIKEKALNYLPENLRRHITDFYTHIGKTE